MNLTQSEASGTVTPQGELEAILSEYENDFAQGSCKIENCSVCERKRLHRALVAALRYQRERYQEAVMDDDDRSMSATEAEMSENDTELVKILRGEQK